MKPVETIALIPDIHVPFHDEQAVLAAMRVVQAVKPNTLVFLGDVLDFPQLSRFEQDVDQQARVTLQLTQARDILQDFIECAPKARSVVYIEGNHEERLQKYVRRHAPPLSYLGALTVPRLLGLDELGIAYVRSLVWHDAVITHGELVRRTPSCSAAAELNSYASSGASGHTHRLSSFFRTYPSFTEQWIECGCLCTLDPEWCKNADWQHGIGLGFYHDDPESTRFSLVPICNGRAYMPEGRVL